MFDPEIKYIGPRHIIVEKNQSPINFWDYSDEIISNQIIIIGGGVSHGKMDVNVINNHQFIAVNSSCRRVFSIARENDFLYFSDNSWSERFGELIKNWRGRVVTSNRNTKIRLKELVNRLDLQDLTEFMKIKSDHVQASSGHTSACLAAMLMNRKKLENKRIILIGFECKEIDGKTHGHDDYQMHDLNPFKERYLGSWKVLAPKFEELGIRVINSTPDSDIKDFEFLPLEEAVRC